MAGLSSSEKHAIWKKWNEEISQQKIATGADKWDVLVSVWGIDDALELEEEASAELPETLDGKGVAEAKERGDALLSARRGVLSTMVPRGSRSQIGDSAHGLLVGLVQQARDVKFRPLPVVEDPFEDLPLQPVGGGKKG